MIDLKILRENSQKIKNLILRKEPSFDVDSLINLDEQSRELQLQIESLRKEKNEIATAASKGITQELKDKSIKISKDIKVKEEELDVIQNKFKALLLSCPNIPQEDIPLGNKEANKAVRFFGSKKEFNFEPKNHVELGEKLDWFDMQAAAQMSGFNFILYKEPAVKLIYALTRLMLKNNAAFGFKPFLPPYLVKESALVNSGNLPKFEGDFYKTQDGLCLIPTAEVNLTNIYADKILSVEQLPIRMTAWTSCFRREAGGHGATDRGLIRIHQFEKVEIYSICEPEKSNEELEYMVGCAESILQKLGLHYRVSLLAAQDCSFASSRTYDLEVWLPGQKQFYEISSCSNCTDFQARRAQIRYRTKSQAKPILVHTLNASSLALPRLMVALMETYQQEDGSILLPEILRKEIDNLW